MNVSIVDFGKRIEGLSSYPNNGLFFRHELCR
jgi:hypothetical protein